jgi:hypothetical protein
VLVETYRRTHTVAGPNGGHRTGVAVILFREGGKFTDAGGGCDPGEDPLDTAQRELKEESMGLFRIDLRKARHERVPVPPNYTAFFVPVKGPPGVGVLKSMYQHNLRVTRHHAALLPSCWQETDAMTRFFIDDLLAAGLMTAPGDLHGAVDVYGKPQVVRGRAKAAIRAFVDVARRVGASSFPLWNDLNLEPGMCSRGLGERGTPAYRATQHSTYCYRL